MSAKKIGLCVLAVGSLIAVFWITGAHAAFSSLENTYVGVDLPVNVDDNRSFMPAVAYNHKHHEYLVVWHTQWTIGTRDIRARRISENGDLLAEFTVFENPTRDSAQPDVAYDPVHDRYLVVWIYDTPGDGSDWDLFGRFIPWEGPDPGLGEFPISTWSSSQWSPKVVYARASEEFLVVWNNEPAGIPWYISGRRIFANGSGFPPGDGFTITSSMTENRVNPDVAYNLARNEYMVVWERVPGDIWGVRLRGDGVPLGTGEFGIAGWPDNEILPAVAACHGADQYLVAWQSDQGGGNLDPYARYISGDGSPGSVLHLIDTPGADGVPDLSCDHRGLGYLAVWELQFSNLTGPLGVQGRLVNTNGTMQEPFQIVSPIAGSGQDRTTPAVAGGSSGFLVAWEHVRDVDPSFQDIHGRLIAAHSLYLPLMRK